jgi:hypothetical protein
MFLSDSGERTKRMTTDNDENLGSRTWKGMTAAIVYKLGSKINLSQEKSVNSRTFLLWELCPTQYGNISWMSWYKGKREADRQPWSNIWEVHMKSCFKENILSWIQQRKENGRKRDIKNKTKKLINLKM